MFSNRSVSVQPEAPHSANGGVPASASVCAVLPISSSQVLGGCTPASSNALCRYQIIDLCAAFTSTPYTWPLAEPSSFQYGV